MAAGSTYTPIANQVLGSSAASVTFSSIPSTYTDLILVTMVQKTNSGSGSGFNMRFNSDTGTNYSNTYLEGSGSSASSYRSSNSTGANAGALTSSAVSTQFDVNINQIMNYSNSTTYKTLITRYNDNEYSYVGSSVSLWRNTAAITSITLYSSIDFAVNSRFTLYGIQAA